MEPLRRILKSLGEFPMLKEIYHHKADTSFDWIELVTKIRNVGLEFNQFFEINVDVDSQETSRNLVYVSICNNLRATKPSNKNCSIEIY